MPNAVRFERYGDVDVLQVVEVPRPVPGDGQVVVRVRAAGINPGEARSARGVLHERWPATFPSGQGSDLAGVVDEVGRRGRRRGGRRRGDRLHPRPGQPGRARRRRRRPPDPRPAGVPWEVAGCALRRRGDRLRRGAVPWRPARGHRRRLRRRRRRGDASPVQLARLAGATRARARQPAATTAGCATTASCRWPTATAWSDRIRDAAGGAGGRVHRHVRRRLRRPRDRARRRARTHRHDHRLRRRAAPRRQDRRQHGRRPRRGAGRAGRR